MGGGGGGAIPNANCHYQNDFCINMGSDESQFRVSSIVRGKVSIKTVSIKPQLLKRKERIDC